MTMQTPARTRTLDVGDIVFESSAVTPEEVAAVTAVLVSAVGALGESERLAPAAGNAWSVGAWSVRCEVTPGAGRWQRYPL
jgi:hypothetical protein